MDSYGHLIPANDHVFPSRSRGCGIPTSPDLWSAKGVTWTILICMAERHFTWPRQSTIPIWSLFYLKVEVSNQTRRVLTLPMMFRWEPEGHYGHRLCTLIASFWFSVIHCWNINNALLALKRNILVPGLGSITFKLQTLLHSREETRF